MRRRGISNVISTVMLVAVGIAVTVAVSYWLGGVSASFTKYEKVEIQTAICTYDVVDTYWKIALKLKNTGTTEVGLIAAFLNGVEVQNYGTDTFVAVSTSTSMDPDASILGSGDTTTLNFYIDLGYMTLSKGTMLNLKLISAGGMEYIELVELT